MPDHSIIHQKQKQKQKQTESLLHASGTGTRDTVMNEEVSPVFPLTPELVSILI